MFNVYGPFHLHPDNNAIFVLVLSEYFLMSLIAFFLICVYNGNFIKAVIPQSEKVGAMSDEAVAIAILLPWNLTLAKTREINNVVSVPSIAFKTKKHLILLQSQT